LCRDPRVRKISFTGSTATGEAITRVAGVKKLPLELGASCPVAILPDADLELAAAVVADVDPASPLSQDELFGPAVAFTSVPDVDAAVRLANATRYGLAAGVFTRDVRNAVRFAREVDAGSVHVNWTPLWRADLMPYGGLKGSGIGKEGPRWAVEEMTELKTVVLHGAA